MFSLGDQHLKNNKNKNCALCQQKLWKIFNPETVEVSLLCQNKVFHQNYAQCKHPLIYWQRMFVKAISPT